MPKKLIKKNQLKKKLLNDKPTNKIAGITYQKEEFLNLENYLLNETKSENKNLENTKNNELKNIIASDILSQSAYKNLIVLPENKIYSQKTTVKKQFNNSPYLLDLRIREILTEAKPRKKTAIKDFILKKQMFWLSKINKALLPIKIKDFNFNFFSLNFWPRLKTTSNFFIICLLIISFIFSINQINNIRVLKEKISIKSAKAITDLLNAADSSSNNDFLAAKNNFNLASLNFFEAKKQLENYNNLIWQLASQLPPTEKKITAVKQIFLAGEKITLSASELTNFFDPEANYLKNKPLWENINILNNNLKIIIENLTILNISLNKLDSRIIPDYYQTDFDNSLKILPNLINNFISLNKSFSVLSDILASEGQKNYLVFFQNTNELRATGGFLGSFAYITIDKGEIKKIDIPGGGPYDLKGGLTKKVIAPAPMHLVGSRWQIWDANWWPDLPTTAKKINWFYEASNGPTVDGIFLINSDLLPRLMEITGNIYLEKFDKLLSSENVINNLQLAVEFEYDKEQNQPKEIIALFAPLLLEKLFKVENDKLPDLLGILIESLEKKDLQMYFNDQTTENKVIDLGWAGQVKKFAGDYLMVVNQNIGGGKTDGVVSQKINHLSEINSNGQIIDTVSITRSHNGDPNDIFEKNNNVSYIRIYVPQGSELIELLGETPPPDEAYKEIADDYKIDDDLIKVSGPITTDDQSGTKINQEFNKTVFGHWLQVKPGEEKTITFKYRLPFTLATLKNNNIISQFLDLFSKNNLTLNKYNLLIQKQSGTKNKIISQLILPANKNLIWQAYSKDLAMEQEGQKFIFYGDLITDQSYAVIIE